MTPKETFAVIEAYFWRQQQQQRQQITMAWLTAGLSRTKRMPELSRLLMSKKAQQPTEAELKERRKEFKQMTAKIDLSNLKLRKRKNAK